MWSISKYAIMGAQEAFGAIIFFLSCSVSCVLIISVNLKCEYDLL